MAGGGKEETNEYTPTWVVAVVYTAIVAVSFAVERFLHYVGVELQRKNKKALYEALQKIKEELMLLGFISLLLTVSEDWIIKIRVSPDLIRRMHPCWKKDINGTVHHLSAEGPAAFDDNKDKVPLISVKVVHDLHIFIFTLAVVHVIYCVLTVFIGRVKIRQWKDWEDSIAAGNYAVDRKRWYTYFWIAFIPCLLLLAVGTKLEHVLMQLVHDVSDGAAGQSDNYFWFRRPRFVLFLIHFIFFQNSFEIGFFFWIWLKAAYNFDACVMGKLGFIVVTLVIGVFIQLLSSCSTLPVYALVTQMRDRNEEREQELVGQPP